MAREYEQQIAGTAWLKIFETKEGNKCLLLGSKNGRGIYHGKPIRLDLSTAGDMLAAYCDPKLGEYIQSALAAAQGWAEDDEAAKEQQRLAQSTVGYSPPEDALIKGAPGPVTWTSGDSLESYIQERVNQHLRERSIGVAERPSEAPEARPYKHHAPVAVDLPGDAQETEPVHAQEVEEPTGRQAAINDLMSLKGIGPRRAAECYDLMKEFHASTNGR